MNTREGAGAEKPDWWVENQRLRDELDLPAYRPPRFADDVPTHEVVRDVEDALGVRVQFVGRDTRYRDDWEIFVDGDSASRIGRHRDRSGNTVFEMTSESFREVVRNARTEDGEGGE